jgi:UDP-N-acetylglucosamine pyrophosphorylase
MTQQLAVVILAAGKGTRMNNPDKAKVMFELAGVPMIHYVVQQALALNPVRIVVVVGFQKQSVMEYIRTEFGSTVEFAHQDQQLGTGHAVAQAESLLRDFQGDVLILSGDVPLLQPRTIKTFAAAHQQARAAVSVLSVDVPDPTGYGRIVRTPKSANRFNGVHEAATIPNGTFERIVEHKDATDAERRITEINSGIYLVHASVLFAALRSVSNNNAQGEYYLTDIVSIVRSQGKLVEAWKMPEFQEVQGVNTVQQLEEAESMLRSMSLFVHDVSRA